MLLLFVFGKRLLVPLLCEKRWSELTSAGALVARKALRCFVQLNRRFGAGTLALWWSLVCEIFRRGVLNRRFNVRTWRVYRHARRKFYVCSLAPSVQLGLCPKPCKGAPRPLDSSAARGGAAPACRFAFVWLTCAGNAQS